MPNLFDNLHSLLYEAGDSASFDALDLSIQKAFQEHKATKEKLFMDPELGLSLNFEKGQFVSIFFHGSSAAGSSGEFQAYSGKLPFGMQFFDTQNDVEAKVDVAPLTTELMPGRNESAPLDLWIEFRIKSVDMTCFFKDVDGDFRLEAVSLSQYELVHILEPSTEVTATELILRDSELRQTATLPIPSEWTADFRGSAALRPEGGETALLSFNRYSRLRFPQSDNCLKRLDFIERFAASDQPFNLIDVHEFNTRMVGERYIYSLNGVCDKMVPNGRFMAHYSFTEKQIVDDIVFHYLDGLWFLAQAPIFERFKTDAEVIMYTAKWCAPLS